MNKPNQPMDAAIRDRIAELQSANNLGLDSLREFWGNPDIRLGFKAWWISISSCEERIAMVTSAYNAAQIKKNDDDDTEEDFLQLNEQAAYRIQLMVTQELQDLPGLAKLSETGEGLLIELLEAIVEGKENTALLTPIDPTIRKQIEEELSAELRLLGQLSKDVKGNHLLTDAIFDRLEDRFRSHYLSVVPFLLKLRIQHLALLERDKRSGSDVEFIMQLVMDSIPHIRTFACTRFFACLINEFIQVIMAPAKDKTISEEELERSQSMRCDYCGDTKNPIKKCGRCHLRQYCGKECQSSHWRLIHNVECSALAHSQEVKTEPTNDA